MIRRPPSFTLTDTLCPDSTLFRSTLANMEDEFRTFLMRVAPRAMVVLDEAHYIKSADGLQATAALRLAPLARARVVLTGTPAPNGYEDLDRKSTRLNSSH